MPDLRRLQQEIASNIYVDPACGAGNFLNVAYAKLRQIETDLIVERRKREGTTTGTLDSTLDQMLTIDKFYGFELNWWPAKIAETAMFLVDHQANRELAARTGEAPDRLPIDITATIVHGNALQLDWNAELPQVDGQTFIFGNPPFLGDNTRGIDQKNDLKAAWGDSTVLSRLDYVTAWHAKTLDLFRNPQYAGEWALVTTNSITQGDQVPRLFGPIFSNGWTIKFAHRTFAWDSEAPGQAAVHCVIVGFTKNKKAKARLFSYDSPKAAPVEQPVQHGINAYLLDAENVLVEKRSGMLSPVLDKTWRGSMPSDGGNLIVEADEYNEVAADPVAAKYLHPYVGAHELMHRGNRWCLWLDGMDPADLSRSTILKTRVEAVRQFRADSKAASTRGYPYHHLFRQLAKQDTDYVCVPRHVSETRRYFTVAHFSADVIASDANFTIRDPDGLQFAVMSSAMFITWQKAIGGRLESRLRFASTLTWYTFPFPEVSENDRIAIGNAGREVLAARALHPERSLAEHYNPLAMDPALVKAHQSVDRLVDRSFGLPRMAGSDEKRLEVLFKNYAEMTPAGSE